MSKLLNWYLKKEISQKHRIIHNVPFFYCRAPDIFYNEWLNPEHFRKFIYEEGQDNDQSLEKVEDEMTKMVLQIPPSFPIPIPFTPYSWFQVTKISSKFPFPPSLSFFPLPWLMYEKEQDNDHLDWKSHQSLKKSRRRSDQDLLACRTRMWHCCCLVSRSFQKAWRRFTNWQRFQVFAHKYSELQPVPEIRFSLSVSCSFISAAVHAQC